MCLPSHMPSSSVRCAIHTSYTKRKSILCLILLSPTPSPLLSCLHSHLPSSSVRCAIHAYYIQKKASSFWFSSPQPPAHYFHASPPTFQVLLLDVPFILLIWKEIALSFFSPPTPPPFPSPTTHLSSLPYEKRIINQPNAISLLIVNWSDCWPRFFFMISFHNLKTLAAVY